MQGMGMPISKGNGAGKAPVGTYEEALDAFLATHALLPGMEGVVQLYRAVQSIPYFSGPDRTPLAALRDWRGACTAKHLVLRDALRRMGVAALVEIVEGDFASGIPEHETMPEGLKLMLRQGDVTDFHCRVRLTGDDAGQALDATWPQSLLPWGFPADTDWTGQGDTRQALAKVTVRASTDDVLEEKARLLAGLPDQARQRRLEFLALLSGWLSSLPTQ
jgi:hypothetical protein